MVAERVGVPGKVGDKVKPKLPSVVGVPSALEILTVLLIQAKWATWSSPSCFPCLAVILTEVAMLSVLLVQAKWAT